jgi:porphyrinogen peroxidase
MAAIPPARTRAWPAVGKDVLVTANTAADAAPEPQGVVTPLSGAAAFLVVVIKPGDAAEDAVRDLIADLPALVRAVGFRDLDGFLSCVTGLSDSAWNRLAGGWARPAGLHPFREIRSGPRHAVSTAGDLLFHIRAVRTDLCFELAAQIMGRIRDAVTVADEVQGFRYFDERDLLGFVDGTENPTGGEAFGATIISADDPADAAFAGGSYVIVQKYLHDLAGWNAIPVEQQERIVGRTKLDNIELDDDVKPTYAHNALTTITVDGEEIDILRDNMPFGAPGSNEFGTYFIGYARSPATIELMLTNMFVGRPPGNYDRLLDVSRAVTGTLFFVPSQPVLDAIGAGEVLTGTPAGADDGGPDDGGPDDGGPDAGQDEASVAGTAPALSLDGSLQIGSLRGEAQR